MITIQVRKISDEYRMLFDWDRSSAVERAVVEMIATLVVGSDQDAYAQLVDDPDV